MCRPDQGMTAMEKASLREYRPERLLEDETSKAAARAMGEKVLAELNTMLGRNTA